MDVVGSGSGAVDEEESDELSTLAAWCADLGLASGRSNSAVAARLHLSEKSVEKHINSIFTKLHLSDEPESNRRVRSVLVWLAAH